MGKTTAKDPKPSALLGRHLARDFRLTSANAVIDSEKKTVRVALTSDEPILHVLNGRSVAYVILDHNPQAINLERVVARSSRILDTHDPKLRLGFQSNFVSDGHVGRIDWRFGPGRGGEVFSEIEDAITNGDSPGVSAGFTIEKVAEKPERHIDGIPVLRAINWTLLEGSIAAIEADLRTGVGRCIDMPAERAAAADDPEEDPAATDDAAAEETDPAAAEADPAAAEEPNPDDAPADDEEEGDQPKAARSMPPPPTNSTQQLYVRTNAMSTPNPQTPATPSPLVALQTRSAEYVAFAEIFGNDDAQKQELREIAREFALTGKNEEELKASIIEKRIGWLTKLPPASPLISLTEGERKRYSIARAILFDANGRDPDYRGRDTDCFELEVSREIERKLNAPGYKTHGGFYLPTGVPLHGQPMQRAGLDAKTATKGQELVFTEPGSFIEMLRNKAVVIQLGATVLPGLQGNVAFPRQTGAGSFSWVGENPGSDVAESNLTLDQVTLSPKTGQSTTSYSRQLLAQGVTDVDSLVTNDLVLINALAVDLAALHGTGVAPQPTGLYALTGVSAVAMAGAITFAKVVDLETAVIANNADIGVMAYLATPEIRGKAKQAPVLANTIGQAIWVNGEMNGYRAEATNQMSKTLGAGSEHGILFGVWSELLIGEWGAIEIITDPYAKKKQGMIEVTSFIMVDINARYAKAFSKGTGLTNT